MAGKRLNRYGEWAQAIKEGRQIEPASLLSAFMAMPHAELAETTVRAAKRIAELKALTVGLEGLVAVGERINAINEELFVLMPQQRAEELASSGGKGKAAAFIRIIAAKEEATNVWPRANRRGWTATQFHTALVNAGHDLPFDTARKWLTRLRQTGAC